MTEAIKLIKKLQADGTLTLYNIKTGKVMKRKLILDPDNSTRCSVVYMNDDIAQNDFDIFEYIPRLIRYGEAQPNYWLAYAETLKKKAEKNDQG